MGIIKRVGLLIKETSDKIVIINYIKTIWSTSTEIVYAGLNRRSLLDYMTRYTD